MAGFSIHIHLALYLLIATISHATIILPKGNGSYNTHLSTAKLVDKSRLDPFAPDRRLRSIMISVFHPIPQGKACDLQAVEYMPEATAKFEDDLLASIDVRNASFENIEFMACGQQAHSTSSAFPVVLFSPGLTGSRLVYGAIAQSVASTGYTVITIDHPYDTGLVEFPDGSLVYGANITSDAQIDLDVAVRAQDVSFLLDQLSSAETAREIFPGTARGLNISRVAMFGHSLGGATTAAAMLNDSRIAGGVNMDGTFHGPVIQEGLDRPFLILNAANHTRFNDDSWAETWPRLRGWKRELLLEGSHHLTFSDYPLVLKLMGLGPFGPESYVGQLLGTIDAERVLVVLTAYLVKFSGFVLKGEEPGILERPSRMFPEVRFV